ncbi:ISL3 family transposase [Saccharopolyspora pogona]|uniref:ISL3 family transposase n=1 Tax=Saccharopolyspora pogona TaxID=333966 RepID=UPI00168490F6|nr:ISL3 family transposase [Saccharopolyspora pogona]
MLLPHLAAVVVERVEQTGTGVAIWARPKAKDALCPGCGVRSSKVHSRYDRGLADAAVGGQPVALRLQVRRFFCGDHDCRVRTFAEQIDGLTTKHARRTPLSRKMLESIGLALAGRAGSRLATALGLRAGRNTLLRLLYALPDPEIGTVEVLGIDDFALLRGHVYGTVLIDIESGRPVDVLPDRTAEPVAAWLREHPGVRIVCRDRATAYAEAARAAAPDAVQVADRFHLWRNLSEAVEKIAAAHCDCLRPPEQDEGDKPAPPEQEEPADTKPAPQELEGKRAANTRARHAAVHELLAKGVGTSAIAESLGMDRKTVRRYAKADAADDMLAAPARHRDTRLRPFLTHLHQRWNEGCTDAAQLYAEIRELGYRGSQRSVRRCLQPLRASGQPAPPVPEGPSVRQATGWIIRKPDNLDEDEQRRLNQVLARCPELDATHTSVRAFAAMMDTHDGDSLTCWIPAEFPQPGVPTAIPDVVLTGHDPSERRAEFRPRGR